MNKEKMKATPMYDERLESWIINVLVDGEVMPIGKHIDDKTQIFFKHLTFETREKAIKWINQKEDLCYEDELKLLNSIEITDYSISSDEVEYIEIEDNENNIEILKSLGATDNDFENMRDCSDDSLEISEFAFRFANWFSPKDGFSLEETRMI